MHGFTSRRISPHTFRKGSQGKGAKSCHPHLSRSLQHGNNAFNGCGRLHSFFPVVRRFSQGASDCMRRSIRFAGCVPSEAGQSRKTLSGCTVVLANPSRSSRASSTYAVLDDPLNTVFADNDPPIALLEDDTVIVARSFTMIRASRLLPRCLGQNRIVAAHIILQISAAQIASDRAKVGNIHQPGGKGLRSGVMLFCQICFTQ